jgi:hypothetical protein
MLVEMFQLLRERQIRQAIAVVGEKFVFSLQVFLNSLEPLSNIRSDSSVSKRDPPFVDVTTDQLQLFATLTKNKVIGDTFIVVKKVILYSVGAVSQA